MINDNDIHLEYIETPECLIYFYDKFRNLLATDRKIRCLTFPLFHVTLTIVRYAPKSFYIDRNTSPIQLFNTI